VTSGGWRDGCGGRGGSVMAWFCEGM